MNAPTKLAAFAVAIVAVFGAAFVVGGALEPVGLSNTEAAAHDTMSRVDAAALPGLASSADGFTLVPDGDTVTSGTPTTYAFRIMEHGATVTEFDESHTKRMHLIVVRRDLTGFQHLHPEMDAAGTWRTDLRLDEPGAYRVFADFVVDGGAHTLGTDLFVPGTFDPAPLPPAARIADAGDGYEVELDGNPVVGTESTLTFTVRQDGVERTDLPEYLGARGHLVILRDGDLAYLHVHAEGDRLAFAADFPSAGTYRMFLQFDDGATIRTAAFTVEIEDAS